MSLFSKDDVCINCGTLINSIIRGQGVWNGLCSNCISRQYNTLLPNIGNSIPNVGKKNDQEKPDLSLIPKDALFEMAKAFTYGANKYGRHNYREGIEISRLLAASMRHITQFNEGEDFDEESKALHLGNSMAGLAMAIYMYYNKKEMDNRYKKK